MLLLWKYWIMNDSIRRWFSVCNCEEVTRRYSVAACLSYVDWLLNCCKKKTMNNWWMMMDYIGRAMMDSVATRPKTLLRGPGRCRILVLLSSFQMLSCWCFVLNWAGPLRREQSNCPQRSPNSQSWSPSWSPSLIVAASPAALRTR